MYSRPLLKGRYILIKCLRAYHTGKGDNIDIGYKYLSRNSHIKVYGHKNRIAEIPKAITNPPNIKLKTKVI